MNDINEAKVMTTEILEKFEANPALADKYPKEFFAMSLLKGVAEIDISTERMVGTFGLIEESNLTTEGLLRLIDYELDKIVSAIRALEKLQAPHGFKKTYRDFRGTTTSTISAFESLRVAIGSLTAGLHPEKVAEEMAGVFQEIKNSISMFVSLLLPILRKTNGVLLK